MIKRSYRIKSKYNVQDERPVEKIVILYRCKKMIRLHMFKEATVHQSSTRYEIFIYPKQEDILVTLRDEVINSVDTEAIKAALND